MGKVLFTALMLSGVSQAAFAQSVEQPATDDAGLTEIVVTAERRATTVQKSSLSIQVLSAKDVETVKRPGDLNILVPGVQIGTSGVNPQIYIRGVGDPARNSRSQPGVQVSVDGVALPRPSLMSTSMFDLERVEVLKGPQGTLYGRNASGGAVNLITARPKLGATSGSAAVEVGNFDLLSGEAALNVPLSGVAALRVAGKAVERDGFLSDGSQDQRTRAARARLLIEPSSAFSILANVDYAAVRGKGSGVSVYPVFQGNPWYANTDTRLLPYPFAFGTGTAPFSKPDDRYVVSDTWGVSAEVSADLGFATLTVIPAFRNHKQEYVSYNSNIRFKEFLDSQTKSVEARLGNDGVDLKWIVGAFYYNDFLESQVYSVQPLAPPVGGRLAANLSDGTIESKSIFGSVTYSPVSGLRLIGGLRYTDESATGTLESGTGAVPEVPYVLTNAEIPLVPAKQKRVNWKAGVEYDVGSSSMLYANVSTGFKGGGTNATPCGGPAYNPETVTQYLAGSRNRFFGNRLQINGEAFLIKSEGQQVNSLSEVCGPTPSSPTQSGFLTFNVGKATIYGANIDLAWAPTDVDRFTFFAEYIKTKADSFVFEQIGIGGYAAAQQSQCTASPGSAAGRFSIDCSGLPLPRVPKWSIQGSYRHEFNFSDGGRVAPSVTAQYVGSRLLDIGYGPNNRAPSYTVLNADISYTAPDGAWSISAFVRNLTNEAIYTSGTNIGANAPNGFRYYTVNVEPPRMYGVRLSANF